MGKRARIIKAVKANPKKFMRKSPYGYTCYGAEFDRRGNVIRSGWPKYSHQNLVFSVLKELGIVSKSRKNPMGPEKQAPRKTYTSFWGSK